MGYEGQIPPVPTREEEKRMIERYEKSFLEQSDFKWYMNESLRLTKIQHGKDINRTRMEWFQNFCIAALVTGPLLVIPLGRHWFRTSAGVPTFYRPKFVYTPKPEYLQARNWIAFKKQFPLWLGLSTMYAFYFTDYSRYDDELLENKLPSKWL